MAPRFSTLLFVVFTVFGSKVALASPPIANPPPSFRIYDVDRRERDMRRLIGQLAGTPSLSHQAADSALGRLDDIKRQEGVARVRHGGRLGIATIRKVDAELNALSRRLSLREPRY
jgi:hypothetical protein